MVAVVALVLVPPLLLWSSGMIATRASPTLGRNVHVAICGLLVSMLALPLANAAFPSAPVSLLTAAAAGMGWAAAYHRSEIVRRLVTVLAVAPLVFVAVFAYQSSIRVLLWGAGSEVAESVTPGSPAPITLVIFDELPLLSLLDDTGAIDAAAYPNFAALAATSTWFRNATSIESRTLQAIPAILSGRYPTADRRLPISSQHPINLFSLLANDYALRVFEPLTNLHAWGTESSEPFTERMVGLARDVSLIYVHTLVPTQWSWKLPPIGEAWGDFLSIQGSSQEDDLAPASGQEPKPGLRGRPSLFRDFVASIRPAPVPSLNFIHTVLPHGPWQYLPSGRAFHPFHNAGRFLGYWGGNEHFIAEAQWRHLQQVELVDGLLGDLLDQLRQIGEFEASLIVVVADHGASFWSQDHYRDFESGQHPADILSVPLFIKRPFQTAGAVDRSNVETIDILPSILDIIDAAIPEPVDGCSLFDSTCPARADKSAFSDTGGATLVRHRYPADLGLDDSGLRQKIARFGSGTGRSAYRASPLFDRVGRTLSEWDIEPKPAGTVQLETARRTWQLGNSESLVPARVVGKIHLLRERKEPIHVAIAAGGLIRAVAPAPADGDAYRIVTLLPEATFDQETAIELFVVTGPHSLARLEPR